MDRLAEEVEGGELAGLAAAHVVGVLVAGLLAPELEEGDDDKDLPLGSLGDGVPLRLGAEVGGGEGVTGGGHGPGPVDVALHAVADEGKHGNAAVLDLGVAEEANGGLVRVAPELAAGEGWEGGELGGVLGP